MHRILLPFILSLFFSFRVFSQGSPMDLDLPGYDIIQRDDILYGKLLPYELHTGIQPYSRRTVAVYTDSLLHNHIRMNKRSTYNTKYLIDENAEWFSDTISKSRKTFWKIFYPEPANMWVVKTKDFDLRVNPGFDFGLGKEIENKQIEFVNDRFVELRGSIKKKLSFYTKIDDNQFRGMTYVQDYINQNQAVPGEGYYSSYKTTGVDYFDARGGIIFNILDHIDVTLAHDKNFWGNGYESFFLSENSAPYFFLKLETTVWHFTYTNLFTQMIADYNRGLDQSLPKKYVTLQHLNYRVTKWLDLGLFEAVTYAGFVPEYINPVIFTTAIQNFEGSPDKSDIGFDYKLNFLEHVQWYGQVLFDEFNVENLLAHNGWWANKFAIQTGLKYVDAFTVDNLDLQLEFNVARPYTFTHSDSATSYTNYNQPIGNPLGANFWEIIGIAKYQITPELVFTGRLFYYEKGLDTGSANFGGDILTPYDNAAGNLDVYQVYGNKIAQGVKDKVLLLDAILSYQIRHNLFADLNFVARNSSSAVATFRNTGIYGGIGLRLNIAYKVHDF